MPAAVVPISRSREGQYALLQWALPGAPVHNIGVLLLDAATGRLLYENRDLTKGAALFADARLYALCEDGWMLLLEPTAASFEERGRFRMANPRDRDAWAHPVICDGRLYLRYHDAITCYDIRATAPTAVTRAP